jgi:hypothetical protein
MRTKGRQDAVHWLRLFVRFQERGCRLLPSDVAGGIMHYKCGERQTEG